MNIVALSTLTGREAVRLATGVEPLTFPPTRFASGLIDGAEFVYVHLHGIPQQPFWYGDGFVTAVSEAELKLCNLRGAICFVANCYGQSSRMVEALFKAGARAVAAGPGTNYTVPGWVRGADLLGQHFLAALQAGRSAPAAFDAARSKLTLRAIFSPIERDALGFTLTQQGV